MLIKKLFFFTFLIVFSKLTFSQTNKLALGVSFGPTLSTVKGDLYTFGKIDLMTSSYFSFKFNSEINRSFNIAADLNYETKGFLIKNSTMTDNAGNDLGEGTTKVKNNYLTIAIKGRVKFGDKVSYYINAGPYFGYLLNSKEYNTPYTPINLGGVYYNGSEKDVTSNFKNIDFGLSAGIGLVLPISNKIQFNTEINNNFGFSNISKYNNTIKTRSMNFGIGIYYLLK
jgi:hypothetical protein